MQSTDQHITKTPQQARLTVRLSRQSLSFSAVDKSVAQQVAFAPYTVRSGMSMAANLRQAVKEEPLLQRGYTKVRALIDAPAMLIPVRLFDEQEAELQYKHTMMGHDGDAILYRVQPSLDAVAVFPVNKDLKLVLTDNFSDVRFTPLMQPVWNYLHHRSHAGLYQKLFAYFHDKRLEVFAFEKNRFRYHNTFDTASAKDALYYILFVWKQLGLDQRQDELHLIGDMPERDTFVQECRQYVVRTLALSPSAEFNRAPLTEIQGMTFDLMALYLGN